MKRISMSSSSSPGIRSVGIPFGVVVWFTLQTPGAFGCFGCIVGIRFSFSFSLGVAVVGPTVGVTAGCAVVVGGIVVVLGIGWSWYFAMILANV